MLDWWAEFSAAMRGEIVNADSVQDANRALRERFAGIWLDTDRRINEWGYDEGSGRVSADFVLNGGMPQPRPGQWFQCAFVGDWTPDPPPLHKLVEKTDKDLAARLSASPC